MFLGETIKEKEFDCKTLNELKEQVEKFVNGYIDEIRKILTDIK